jgi:hypothetical protein
MSSISQTRNRIGTDRGSYGQQVSQTAEDNTGAAIAAPGGIKPANDAITRAGSGKPIPC